MKGLVAHRRGSLRTLPVVALVVTMMVSANAADKSKKEPADVIYVNGDIYPGASTQLKSHDSGNFCSTMRIGISQAEGVVHVDLDRPVPPDLSALLRATAMAVRGGRIIAVGSDASVRSFKGPHTQLIDLHRHFVMPGFNDAHAHLAGGGLGLLQVDLVGSTSLADMQQRIARGAAQLPAGTWVVGRGWDHTRWPGQKLPTRQDIDAACGDHPAVFSRVDGHIAVVNTPALKASGIDAVYARAHPGQVDVDSAGRLTGIVREEARDFVLSRLPPPTPEQRRRGIEMALAEAARWGVTSVQDSISNEQDPTEWQNFLVYEELEREGKLTARVTVDLNFMEPLSTLELHRARHAHDDPMLHTGMLGEAYLDGSLGSRTAALFQPYSDDPQDSGVLYFDLPKLIALADERATAGFQVGFHAIGDRAAGQALDAFADAERLLREHNAGALPDVRFRIEHAQVTSPAQLKRMGELRVIASIQPCQLLTDMNWAEARLGPERARASYAWRSMLSNGVMLAFGTDWPVEPLDPFRGLYAAVTRKNEAGDKSYFPDQKLTLDEAIAAYTTGAAFAEYMEKDKGLLAPGFLADFVVLDRDLTRVPPAQILGARVLRTVVGGNTVFAAK